MTKKRFDELIAESKESVTKVVKKDSLKPKKKKLDQKKLDSVKKSVSKKLDNSYIPIPKETKEKILEEIEKEAKDTTSVKLSNGNRISFGGNSTLDKFVNFNQKYPDAKIDDALDSLQQEKTFTNRFLYTRAKAANKFIKSKENREKYISDLLSYGSVSIFIFLPFFTLFLKLFYFRRKYTYVDHLVFVFHTQTVFFMMLTIVYLISFFANVDSAWVFILLFLLYLFIAMKKFYQQSFFKTFIKFCMLNWVYMFLGIIGITIVGLISFVFY